MVTQTSRIAILTTAHPWNDPRIYQKMAHSLAAAGLDVTLIAQQTPAQPIGKVRFDALPKASGRLHRMIVLPLIAFGRSLKYNVVHFHDPELIPVALALKLLGRRVIYDVHEDLPRQIQIKHWIPAWQRSAIAGAVERLEQFAAAVFDRVVAATPKIALRFPAGKTIVVKNYPIVDDSSALSTPYEQRDPDFIYAGVITEERGASSMLDAFAQLGPTRSRFHFAGNITTSEIDTNIRAVNNTVIHGVVDRITLDKLYRQCCAGLVVLHPTSTYVESLPTKMFEYMLAGMPVIASNFPLWADILNEAKAGLLVDPLDSQQIADAMRWLLDNPGEANDMGRRGRDIVLMKYQWAIEAGKLQQMYQDI